MNVLINKGYSGILVGCMARFGIAQFRARAQ
jgi:hypothetical protein